jgi:hypothetical protein
MPDARLEGADTFNRVEPYPPIEPYAHGLLDVGDDNQCRVKHVSQ